VNSHARADRSQVIYCSSQAGSLVNRIPQSVSQSGRARDSALSDATQGAMSCHMYFA
jgi:hypothetical protein